MTPVPGSLTTSAGAIHFVRQGHGRPVFLLPGLATTHRSFARLIEHLPEKYTTVAFDLLGHGESDLDAPDLSVPAQAEAIQQFVLELDFRQVTLVGHSAGGSVAIQVAAALPERIRSLVLIASGSYEYRLPFAWRLLRQRPLWSLFGLVRPLRALALRRAARLLYARPDLAASSLATSALKRSGWAALGRAFRQNTSDKVLSEIETLVEHRLLHPTLIFWGTDDRLVPVRYARQLFRDKKNTRFIEVAGGSHGLHEESHDLVNDIILEFLE
jgi:pimeloyl-ACP methyl ester carboxylesterase